MILLILTKAQKDIFVKIIKTKAPSDSFFFCSPIVNRPLTIFMNKNKLNEFYAID